MKKSVFTAFIFAAIALVGLSAFADDKPISPEEMQAKMAESQALVAPGEEHKVLETLVGQWSQEIRFWMQPGAEPVTTKGQTANKMILGGRFLACEFVSTDSLFHSEGLTIMGFDRRHKVYTLVGFDTWGTYYITAAGNYDKTSKTLTMPGEDTDPVFGLKQTYEMVMHLESPDRYVTELYFKNMKQVFGSDSFKMVEIINTRKK